MVDKASRQEEIFYERCVDLFFGGAGTQPEWATGGLDIPTIMENTLLNTSLNARRVRTLWENFIASSDCPRSSLYYHVPFCETNCTYCPFFKSIGEDEQEVESYVDRLVEETRFFLPVLKALRLNHLYVGGGSPSVLSLDQIERLFKPLLRQVRFNSDASLTFECNPLTVTKEKLHLLRDIGFNRISMGVQTTNQGTLQKMGRGYQTWDMLQRISRWIHSLGYPMYNLDLILGFHQEDDQAFLRSFEAIASLKPSEISVNLLRPIKKYIRAFYDGDTSRSREDVARAIQNIEPGIEDFALKLGYRCGGRGTNVWFFHHLGLRDSGRYSGYDDRAGEHILGIGSSARSTISGVIAYEERVLQDKVFDPGTQWYRAVLQDSGMAMAVYVLRQLQSSGFVSSAEFKKHFGRKFIDMFAEALRALQALERIHLAGDRWKLKARDSRQRLLYGLFFMGRTWLRGFLNNCERIVTRIDVEVEGRPLQFRIERQRPDQKYYVIIQGVGLQVTFRPTKSRNLSQREQHLLRLLEELFRREILKEPWACVQEVALKVHGRLSVLLAKGSAFGKGIELKPICIEAVDEDPAGLEDEKLGLRR